MKRDAIILLAVGMLATGQCLGADPSKRYIYAGADGKLVYDVDAKGNRTIDFSHCGYGGGGVAIPLVPVRVVVASEKGDGTARLQAALDEVARLPADAHGFRGAVLLKAGRHEVAGSLRIAASGVVLRGEGPDVGGTLLVATGVDRRTLVRIVGQPDRRPEGQKPYALADAYVPTGATRLRLTTTTGLNVGSTVAVEHVSTKAWIAALGMDRFPSRDVGSWLDWTPGSRDIRWDRTIVQIDGDTVTLDAPLTFALDAALAPCRLRVVSRDNRIRQVGVENLRCESTFDASNPRDEEHAWFAVSMEHAEDIWVRQVTARHFAGSTVTVAESCRRVTVEDCRSLAPVSELGGWRRHTFFTAGQQTLFQRCRSEEGRHDFAVGSLAAGPNAFVDCEAANAHGDSGPIGSWASGVLYDNVTIDGGALALTNRETEGQGIGWTTANGVLWNCVAPRLVCRRPPTANNYAIGVWGEVVGDGSWRSLNEFVKPDSLYRAQLGERGRVSAPSSASERGRVSAPSPPSLARRASNTMDLHNGWLVADNRLLTGNRVGTTWWRGSVLPAKAPEFGLGVTRFVPGLSGPGYTDDLDTLTESMKAKNQTVLEHHYGLWYDRRRDDHQMVRRLDGDVWPPFYEQPWARSGQGTAWDGLSKYDLTKFNAWYFGRLKQFANLCDRKGLVLVQQMYFQHNLLEAGAHYADFPWRPANCLQDTGFPEPPPYVNRKRIFVAEAFYDVSHPVRRNLHRAYIRHCLDVLGGNRNVIFQTGEEFTGPRTFVEFWLDTIEEWQKETDKKVLVGLSCTKDVQDAILADPRRQPLVSAIDMKYWWYTANGGTYDPKGAENLAPRQQLREWKGSKSRSDASVARQVHEYRCRFPDKAILCSLDGVNGWAVAAAGGSIPNLPSTTEPELLAALPRMKPQASQSVPGKQWVLSESDRRFLVFHSETEPVRLRLPSGIGSFRVRWLDFRTGRFLTGGEEVGGGAVEIRPPHARTSVLWVAPIP